MGVQSMSKDATYFKYLLKKETGEVLEEEEEDFPGTKVPINRPGGTKKKRSDTDDRMFGANKKRYRIGGELLDFYTIGDIAKAVGRTATTLRSWEDKGLIPFANYRTPPPKGEQIPGIVAKGRRLYTVEQAEFLLDAVEHFMLDERSSADWQGFRKHTAANWPL